MAISPNGNTLDGKVLFAKNQVLNLTILSLWPNLSVMGGVTMRRGQIVEVTEAFAGQQLKAVTDWDDQYVFVCRREEYLRAQREKREPVSIGFPKEFVREGPQ